MRNSCETQEVEGKHPSPGSVGRHARRQPERWACRAPGRLTLFSLSRCTRGTMCSAGSRGSRLPWVGVDLCTSLLPVPPQIWTCLSSQIPWKTPICLLPPLVQRSCIVSLLFSQLLHNCILSYMESLLSHDY